MEVIDVGKFLHTMGWVPATSGNISMRIDEARALITCSGQHLGFLEKESLLVVDMEGAALEPAKVPSAECLLHTAIYRIYPWAGAVLHTHSVNGTVLSRSCGSESVFRDHEMLKAFRGITTHETEFRVPIFENSQDMGGLSTRVKSRLRGHHEFSAFLIRDHGLYAWGADMPEARRHVEALEFLFSCELTARRNVP
jgi:methylthioribulose-1-phosphate dehydratase